MKRNLRTVWQGICGLLCVAFLNGCATIKTSTPMAATPADLQAESHLLILSNDVAVVGLLPRLAGRTVLYRLQSGRNVLHSDPAQWSLADDEYPSPSATTGFDAFNGHIVKVGPQKDWWVQQNENPKRKQSRERWPPDPWLLYADYRIVEQADNYVKLESPDSPISGLKLTKETSLLPDGRVRHRVTATNIRDTDLHWDLWTSTRLPGTALCYIPIADTKSAIRIDYDSTTPASVRPPLSDVINGFFTFRANTPLPEGVKQRAGKAFVSPFDCVIAGFNDDRVLVKRIPRVERQAIHPEQALIEVYQDASILEMDAHGPYSRIRPGASISFTEQWAVYHYSGAAEPQEQTAFLKKLRIARLPPGSTP